MIDCKELGLENVPKYQSGVLSVKGPRRTEVVLTQTAGTDAAGVSGVSVTRIEPVR